MTVIVADSKTMCGDTRCIHHEILVGTHRKVHIVRDMVVGYAGCMDSGMQFLEWVKRGMGSRGKPMDLHPDFCGLILNETGIYEYTNFLVPLEVGLDYWAVGSGAQAALGAMRMGATPKQAAEIACEIAPGCGTPITVESLPV